MKILLCGINFVPEPTGIGKYTGEMAAWLADAGHEVRVVTAPPYYPGWQVGAGYSAWRYRTEQWQGVQVTRCPLWVPVRPSGSKRVLHLLSFAVSSIPALVRQVFWRPDVVWLAAPAFACAPGALLAAKLSGAPAWLHVQDYEIDVAFDMGLLRGKLARAVVTRLERWIFSRFDVVSSISQRMLRRAAEKGVAPRRIVHFPNWVDVDAVVPLNRPSRYRQQLGLAPDAVVALFSGTLSAKQGLHLLPQAAALLAQSCPEVAIVICGDGVAKASLQAATQGMPNVHLLPLQPKDQVPELLGMADMHLLPQEADVADLVMPSKLTAMLSSGRPVVTTARAGTEVADVVHQCGLVAAAGSAQALARAIEQLARNPGLRAELGQAARDFAVQRLSIESVLGRFNQKCLALVGGTVPASTGAADQTAPADLGPIKQPVKRST